MPGVLPTVTLSYGVWEECVSDWCGGGLPSPSSGPAVRAMEYTEKLSGGLVRLRYSTLVTWGGAAPSAAQVLSLVRS